MSSLHIQKADLFCASVWLYCFIYSLQNSGFVKCHKNVTVWYSMVRVSTDYKRKIFENVPTCSLWSSCLHEVSTWGYLSECSPPTWCFLLGLPSAERTWLMSPCLSSDLSKHQTEGSSPYWLAPIQGR